MLLAVNAVSASTGATQGFFKSPGRDRLQLGDTSIGGNTCTEATRCLNCRNRKGHGFFLSLRSWHVF